MIIEKATGTSLSNYLSQKFWDPMGAENLALWQIDSEEYGMEKAYCCIAGTARDFDAERANETARLAIKEMN